MCYLVKLSKNEIMNVWFSFDYPHVHVSLIFFARFFKFIKKKTINMFMCFLYLLPRRNIFHIDFDKFRLKLASCKSCK